MRELHPLGSAVALFADWGADEAFALPPELVVLADVTNDPNLKNRALALAMAEWERDLLESGKIP